MNSSVPIFLSRYHISYAKPACPILAITCSFIMPTLHTVNGDNIQSTNCGLNRNVCCRLTCLNILFPSGSIVWKVVELSGGGSLEKVGRHKCALRIGSLAPLPVRAQLPIPPRREMRSSATMLPCTAPRVIFTK